MVSAPSVRRLLLGLLCLLMALGHPAHASVKAERGSGVFCGMASAAMMESVAALAPDEFAALMRQAAADDDCERHCGSAPPLPLFSGLRHVPPPAVDDAPPRTPSVPLGAGRAGRLHPPATAPPSPS